MSGFIAWLDDSAQATAGRVGGKAASLARLTSAGFPVPPGFGVTVDAYRAFHTQQALATLVEPLVSLPARHPLALAREASAPILAKLDGAALPESVSKAVAEAHGKLVARATPGATFAVRSSGVSEDGAVASFAGLYESYLNLSSANEVIAAVLRCYRCLWEPRAVQYRALKGVDHRREAMGVVVMQTIASHVSGVAFSKNPVTGDDDEVVINASWGLGEAIVSGLVTPDSYVAAKDGFILEREIAEKAVRVVTVPGGTERQDTPGDVVDAPALTDEQVEQVATTTAAVEAHYGVPIDIEFAYDSDGRFYLLQARPITTR